MNDWEFTNGRRANRRPVVLGGSAFTSVNVFGRVDSQNPTTSYGGVGHTPVARKVVYPSGGGTDYEQEGFIVFPSGLTTSHLAFIGLSAPALAHGSMKTRLEAYANGSGGWANPWQAHFRFYGVTSWGGHGTLPSDPNPINWNNKGDVVLTPDTGASAFWGSIRANEGSFQSFNPIFEISYNAIAVYGVPASILGIWFKVYSVTAPGFSVPASGDFYSAAFEINPSGAPGYIKA